MHPMRDLFSGDDRPYLPYLVPSAGPPNTYIPATRPLEAYHNLRANPPTTPESKKTNKRTADDL